MMDACRALLSRSPRVASSSVRAGSGPAARSMNRLTSRPSSSLARNAGALVIGLASGNHHPWLKKHDITPIEYGDGMESRILAAANHGRVEAFIDTFGGGYVDLALGLGVQPNRIDTIIDFVAAERHHVRTAGNADGARPEVMEELARMIDEGDLEIPIQKIYHLDQVREAYREVAKRHTLGKMVLVP